MYANMTLLKAKNNMGFAIDIMYEYTTAFLERKVHEMPMLEIGAGYGLYSLKAIEFGHEIICNDLIDEHIDQIKENVPGHLLNKINFFIGSFPEEVSIKHNSVSAILIARVLHLLKIEHLENAIKSMHDILVPDGKMYVTVETLYLPNWTRYLPEFERKLQCGDKWPGYIIDINKYEASGIAELFPETIHLFTKEILSDVFQNAGFTIEKCSCICRKGIFPEEYVGESRESVGVIAVKNDI